MTVSEMLQRVGGPANLKDWEMLIVTIIAITAVVWWLRIITRGGGEE